MKRRITLNTKLLGFALLLVMFTVIVAVVSFLRGQVLKTKNDVQLLYVELLKANTHAKLFLRSRQMSDVQAFNESSEQFSTTLQRYRDEWFSQELLLGVERFNGTFAQILGKMKERGLDENSGAEGAFRKRVHALQSIVEESRQERLNLILLEARRREKDYFLRSDTAYASNVRNAILLMLNQLTASKVSVQNQQQMQRLALGYLQEFEHTVRTMQELTLLEQSLEKEFRSIEPVIRRIETLKQREAADQEQSTLIITVISLVFSIFAAFFLARRIAAPIVDLQRASQRLATGDYSVAVEARSNDEIADLGVAFNLMTANVRERTEELNASYHNLRVLSGIGRDISSTLENKTILTMLYRNVVRLVEADMFAIGMFDERSDSIKDLFTIKRGNYLPLFETPMSAENSLAVWCLEHRSEVFINDNSSEYTRYVNGLYVPSEIFLPQEFPQSMMFLPLLLGDKAIGVITVQSFQRNAYTSYHLDIMRTLAAYTASALNNANAYQTVQDQNREILRQQSLLEEQASMIQIANTQLQEHNLQLEVLNQEKNEFLGIAAHDLKNPLASIQMAASIVQHYYDQLDRETIIERAATIVSSSKRMSEIITNLLDINAIESGGMSFTLRPFDLVALVSQMVEEYKERAAAKNIKLHFDVPEDYDAVPMIFADQNATTQVLDNLVSNAVKYSPKGCNVWIRIEQPHTTEEKGVLQVLVRDEGQGVSPEDMKRLFGKFARLSAQPTGGEHSTGLGLSIVKKMVEAMNGKVWCESESGKGATFIMELPTASASENHIVV